MVEDRDEEDQEVPKPPSLAESDTLREAPKPTPAVDDGNPEVSLEEQTKWQRNNILTNAAVLCEVLATSVDYTIPDEDKPGDYLMTNACSACKIYLITKGLQLPSGKSHWSTSIWAVSNDRYTRLEQPLPEEESIIPYTVWGSPSRVILRIPSDLRYHDTSADDKPLATARSSWVTYAFGDETTATMFQNALMDRSVLLSAKTKRTMRVHEGLGGVFAFSEQLCGLENLRVVAEPTTGVVSVMIHYSPAFSEGYMLFNLNVKKQQVKVKEESETVVRIKGLKIKVGSAPVGEGGKSIEAKKREWEKGDKCIKGARIEFSSGEDKRAFVDMVREVQAGVLV